MRSHALPNLRRVTAAAAVGTVLLGLSAHSAPSAHPQASPTSLAPAVAFVRWLPCDQVLGNAPPVDPKVADCAVRSVPRDHSRPADGTVEVVMLRHKARNPGHRRESLFVNPGGPGQSGLHFAYRAEKYLTGEVLARYDVIGFDPRGVGQSAAVKCFTSQEEADAARGERIRAPRTPAETATTIRADRAYTDACARDAGPLLPHVTTADVARDLDLLRQGVKAPRLNFAGFSYGSMIGATYTNLFPRHTGALILDGNIDPLLRMTDGPAYDRRRADGAEDVLRAFLRDCVRADERCAFGDGSPATALNAIHDRLRQGPLTLPGGGTVDSGSFSDQVLGALSDGDLTGLATSLKALQAVMDGSNSPGDTTPARLFRVRSDHEDQNHESRNHEIQKHEAAKPRSAYRGDDSGDAVNCSEKPYPRRVGTWSERAASWERTSPTFGRAQAFDSLPCATWPVRPQDTAAYTGPWDRPVARTALVVGNRLDPVTPHLFAERMADRLANARLLTADMYGHTAMGLNTCVDELATRYLIDGDLPRPGTVCPANEPPFGSP
ncbi:alpha/beta hydrolase [Streptomyces sp. A5-4]|uniref:alpha/beta hydrolase n=1 Tax=Streptomyces sp. A5-4 TaxID=3384771 RepID=UPI003DA831C7